MKQLYLNEKVAASNALQGIKVGSMVEFSYRTLDGDKAKIQKIKGQIIAIKGTGLNKRFFILRNAAGLQVEQSFLFLSPNISNLSEVQKCKIRRSKLYFLRGLVGKKSKLRVLKSSI